VAARRIRVRPAVLDQLTGTIGATEKRSPARGRSGPCGFIGGRRRGHRLRPAVTRRRRTTIESHLAAVTGER
jgi:hypothetical protein